MERRAPIAVLLLALAFTVGACQRRGSATGEPSPADDDNTPAIPTIRGNDGRAQASRRSPAGAACSGRDDCTSDQICVEARCAYRATSVAAEVLAAAAGAQAEAGDWEGAIESYEQSFAASREHDAPVPPEVVCAAAELTLRSATDPAARERGARHADLCFRATVPGHPARQPVRRALARLRYEGLEIALFDEDEPAERFFTQEPSRPTVDVVQVEVQMPDLEPVEPASHGAVRDMLAGEDGRRSIAECFVQDWELRHESTASAELVFRYSTRLRDMGNYDVYEPLIAVEQTTTAEDGFEACLHRAIPAIFDPNNRSIRGEPWNQAIRINAHIQ